MFHRVDEIESFGVQCCVLQIELILWADVAGIEEECENASLLWTLQIRRTPRHDGWLVGFIEQLIDLEEPPFGWLELCQKSGRLQASLKPQEIGVDAIDKNVIGLNGDGSVGGAGQTLKRAQFWGLGGDWWKAKSQLSYAHQEEQMSLRV